MPRHRSDSTEFKRQVVAEHHAGETLYAVGWRHDLHRIWVEQAESGSLAFAELLSEYKVRSAALERLVGREALVGDRHTRAALQTPSRYLAVYA